MSRKSERKKEHEMLLRALQCDEFPWDYSYFKWQDIPREVRREMVIDASKFGRMWMLGQTSVVADIFKCDARKMYNKNWDGCRDVWKENYRRRKLFRYTD